MAWFFIDAPFAADLAAATNPRNTNWQGKTQTPPNDTWAGPEDPLVANAVPLGAALPGLTANGKVVDTQHQDFHFRFWVIPAELRLSNPTVNTDIPFLIWNTLPDQQTLTNLTINGSNVLSFDILVGNTVRDFELRTVNMQIAPGEPNIDALVNFVFTDGGFVLPVIATVSETFNLVPDVPVRETWEFLTDIITAHDGTEQRIALRRNPRRTMDFDVDILDLDDRREQYELTFKNMGLQAIIPAYHHATQITQTTGIGGNKYFFDPSKTQMRVGEFLVAINPETESATIASVISVDVDGATVGSAAGEDITPAYYVYPAHAMILRDGSGLNMQNVSGKLNLRAEGFSTPALPRPNATPTIQTLDGVNIMDRRPLISAEERFTFRKDVLDFDVGIKDIARLGDPHARVRGNRQWLVNRYDDKTADEDFFREFIDQARGAHKAFFMPTWFPDLQYTEGATQLGGSLKVADVDYPGLFFPHNTWKQIMIEYNNDLAPTFHTVTTATVDQDGENATLGFTPPLPDDPRVTDIKWISFLLKVRGSDTIRRRHLARDTFYDWAIQTVDD